MGLGPEIERSTLMNASHLRELIELGITGATLIRVAEIIDEETSAMSADKTMDTRIWQLESTAEQRRKERDKQRKRDARAANKTASPNAQTSTDCPQIVRGQPLILPLTEEEKKEESKVGKKENKRGTRLLSGARISDENRAVAIDEGCPPGRVDSVWTEFVDYWSDIPGQRGLKLSWTGTWRNWVKRLFAKGNQNGGRNGNAAPRGVGGKGGFSIIAAKLRYGAGEELPFAQSTGDPESNDRY
jgi:hypothetical protein